MRGITRICSLLATSIVCGGCVFLPQAPGYRGPVPRPTSLLEYYSDSATYSEPREKVIEESPDFVIKEIRLPTSLGEVVIDSYEQQTENDDLVFVFPVLGGKYMFERYFARYFAERGFDTAIVHRNNEFRNPENIDRIEEIFRQNIIRDRLVLDFFEERRGKRDFASFGLSRGAINASMLAGVDPRLKHNVLILGGSNLVSMFRDSGEKGIKKFIRRVTEYKKISKEELFTQLRQRLRTDPQYVAKHIDARNTLLILALFDQSVPVEYGFKLRRQIGRPETVLLLSGHYTSLLYTQFIQLFPPNSMLCILPYDFVETEALTFFNRKLRTGRWRFREVPVRIIKIPFHLFGRLIQAFD